MDIQVEWSPEAVEDLESITGYIARDSEFYARSVVTKILEVSRSISDFPLMGTVVSEIGDENIRERIVYNYRLVYRIEKKKILVIAVIHGRRLFENISERFETDS